MIGVGEVELGSSAASACGHGPHPPADRGDLRGSDKGNSGLLPSIIGGDDRSWSGHVRDLPFTTGDPTEAPLSKALGERFFPLVSPSSAPRTTVSGCLRRPSLSITTPS